MQFFYRLGFYLGGFSIGLVFLFFILNGKRTQCHYGPQARVLNDLSQKNWDFSAVDIVSDSITLQRFLKSAEVDFGKSNTQRDSCKLYHLSGFYAEKEISFKIENCSKIVRVFQ